MDPPTDRSVRAAAGRLIRWLRGWPAWRWLVIMVIIYFAAAFYGAWFNYVSLHFNGVGTYDLGINQQAVASSAHGGYPYPFYESTNCGRNDRCSFLLVHPAFVAYLVVPVYALSPTPFTLFAIQDFMLAMAAFPLLGATRLLTKSNRLALVTAGIYLVWLPAFAGVFSFHWEAFFPLWMFTIFYLFLKQRYLASIPFVILAYITLEIGAVFLFCLGLFFLLPWLPMLGRYIWGRLKLLSMARGPAQAAWSRAIAQLEDRLVRSRLVPAAISLMVASACAYILLHEFVSGGEALLGLPPIPPAYQLPLDQPVRASTFTLANFLFHSKEKLLFWIVIFATLGFIPLLAPRTAVVWGPWIFYTTVTTSGFYVMGNQYGFLSASVLFIGFVYGLVRLQRWANGTHTGSLWTRFWHGGAAAPAPTGSETTYYRAPRVGWFAPRPSAYGSPLGAFTLAQWPTAPLRRLDRRRTRSWQIIGAVAAVIVVFNLALNPLIPGNAGLRADRPFASQSSLGITGLPDMASYDNIESLVSLIPANSFVAASPYLFTFVATDPHAYSLLQGMSESNFPWAKDPAPNIVRPSYILVALNGKTIMPYWLNQNTTLYANATELNSCIRGHPNPNLPAPYAVRAWIPDTKFLGGVLLFEQCYTSTKLDMYGGPAPDFKPENFTAKLGIHPGKDGVRLPDPSALSGWSVSSKQKNTTAWHEGHVFETPGLTLQNGTYNVTLGISGNFSKNETAAGNDTNVSEIGVRGAPDDYVFNATNETYGDLSGRGWILLRFVVEIPGPVLALQVWGRTWQPWAALAVDFVDITRLNTDG